jgi:hypothetical protein
MFAILLSLSAFPVPQEEDAARLSIAKDVQTSSAEI